jgi:hypothetical protein
VKPSRGMAEGLSSRGTDRAEGLGANSACFSSNRRMRTRMSGGVRGGAVRGAGGTSSTRPGQGLTLGGWWRKTTWHGSASLTTGRNCGDVDEVADFDARASWSANVARIETQRNDSA